MAEQWLERMQEDLWASHDKEGRGYLTYDQVCGLVEAVLKSVPGGRGQLPSAEVVRRGCRALGVDEGNALREEEFYLSFGSLLQTKQELLELDSSLEEPDLPQEVGRLSDKSRAAAAEGETPPASSSPSLPRAQERRDQSADELVHAGVKGLAEDSKGQPAGTSSQADPEVAEARAELEQARMLRSEAARAVDEAMGLRRRLFVEEQMVAQKLQRGRQEQAEEREALAQERRQMAEERREVALEFAKAKDLRASAEVQWEAVQRAAKEARLAAASAVQACDAANEKRRELEAAMAAAADDFAMQRREEEAMAERGSASWDLVHSLEHEARERGREASYAERELCEFRALMHEEMQSCVEIRNEHDRLVRELRDLSRLSRWATRLRVPGT